MFKKTVLSVLTFLILSISSLGLFVPQTKAQSDWWRPTWSEFDNKVNDTTTNPPQEIFGERYTAAQVTWIMWGLVSFIKNGALGSEFATCIMTGGDVTACKEKYPLTDKSKIQPVAQSQKSVLATLFPPTRSVSFVNYTRGKFQNWHLVPEAEAQGFGFSALSPVQNIWRIFRDISFGFMVVITLILAFMVMFRAQLDPKTVVTAQSAIPRVIVTVVLIAFSYAIAGFLIDLTYVAIGIVALIFQQTGILNGASWQDIFGILTDGPQSIGGGMIGWMVILGQVLIAGVLALFWSNSGFIPNFPGAPHMLGLLATILTVIFIVWALLVAARSLLTLIKAYISVIISVTFGTLQILIGAISPGSGFNPWVRGLCGNLACFVTTGALLITSVFFIAGAFPSAGDDVADALVTGSTINSPFACDPTTTTCTFWYPPLTLGTQTSTFDPLPFLFLVAGLYVISIIPQAGTIAQSLFAGKGLAGGIDPRTAGLGGMAFGAAASQLGGQLYGRYASDVNLRRGANIINRQNINQAAAIGTGQPHIPTPDEIRDRSRADRMMKS